MGFFVGDRLFIFFCCILFMLTFYFLKVLICLGLGLLLKYEFIQFTFLCFTIVKENDKIKFKIQKTGMFVFFSMQPRQSNPKSNFIYGMVPSFLCIAISIAFIILAFKANVFGDLTTALIIILALNIIPEVIQDLKEIKKCLGNGPEAQVIRFNCDLVNKVNQGVRPLNFEMVDIPPYSSEGLDKSYLFYLFLKFNYYLENQKFIELKPIINAFADNMPKVFNETYTPQAYSLLFYYSFVDVNSILANNYYYYVEDKLLKDKGANGCRIYAYYLYFIKNDKAKAYDIATHGLELCDKFPNKGLSIMEHDLLEHLLNVMSTENNYYPNTNLNTGINKSFSVQ